MSPGLSLAELRQRKIVQWAVAYAAAAWVLLQVVAYLDETFGWPAALRRGITVVIACGFLAVLVIAWYHGERGRQRVGGMEIAALAGVLAIAAAGVVVVGGSGEVAPAGPGSGAEEASIAVLPLVNLSGDPANDFLGEGVSDEILGGLARLTELTVIGRTSSFRYRGSDVDAREVGRDLNVGTVLSGSVRAAEDRVRIRVELVDATTGRLLWSQQYDRRMEGLFELENEISRAVAAALRVELAGAGRPLVGSGTGDPEAHALALQAAALTRRSDEASLERAIEQYEEALARDPEYAEAWVGLGNAWGWLADAYRAPKEVVPRAREAAERAVALDDSLAAGHLLLGYLALIWEWDFPAARREIERALELDPGVPDGPLIHGIYLYVVERDFPAAWSALDRASALDPFNPFIPWLATSAALAAGDFDGALRHAERVREIDPAFHYFMDSVAEVRMAQSRWKECVAAHDDLPEAARAEPQYGLAICLARDGRRQEARAILDRLEAASKDRYVDATTIGTVYAALGDLDTAFAWLDRAYEDRSARLSHIEILPEFEPLRGDPRYAALVERIGLGGAPR